MDTTAVGSAHKPKPMMYGPSRQRIAVAVALGVLGAASFRFTPLRRPLYRSVELRHLSTAGCISSALLVLRAGRRDAFDDIFQFIVDGDFDRAKSLFQKLAEAGSPRAQHCLADLIRFQLGVALIEPERSFKLPKKLAEVEELKEVLEWYRRAADQGDPQARLMYYELLYNFSNEDRELRKIEYPRKSEFKIELRRYEGELEEAKRRRNEGEPKTEQERKRDELDGLRTDAEAGNWAAQLCFGCYLRREKQYAAASEWFSKALDQGYFPAYTHRCKAMFEGAIASEVPEAVFIRNRDNNMKPVSQERLERVQWAMDQGVVGADRKYYWWLAFVGYQWESGNWQAGEGWQQLRKAADEEGIAEAQYAVGVWLLDAQGKFNRDGSFDDPKVAAAGYFKRAADQGHAEALTKYYKIVDLATVRADAEAGVPLAQWELGWRMVEGKGSATENPTEGARWILKAAEKGVVEAQDFYAQLLSKGKGVGKDEDLARRWGILSGVSRLREL